MGDYGIAGGSGEVYGGLWDSGDSQGGCMGDYGIVGGSGGAVWGIMG